MEILETKNFITFFEKLLTFEDSKDICYNFRINLWLT